MAHSESGMLWVDWLDGNGQLGYVQLGDDGEFGETSYVNIEEAGGQDEARDLARDNVLSGS